jgi:hypothetical protein
MTPGLAFAHIQRLLPLGYNTRGIRMRFRNPIFGIISFIAFLLPSDWQRLAGWQDNKTPARHGIDGW